MKITGKHEYELPVAVEFEIASAPKIEQIEPTALRCEIKANVRKIKKVARTIKKDTKRLLRVLERMKRHGWAVVDQQGADEEPAPRAEDAKRGRWVMNLGDDYFIYCSECGAEPPQGTKPQQCPNCGAKMDGEEARQC